MKWDLTKIYQQGLDDSQFLSDLRAIIPEAEAIRTLIAGDSDALPMLREVIARLQALLTQAEKAGSLIFLTLATDAENEQALSLYDSLMEAQVELKRVSSALSKRLAEIDSLEELIASDPLLHEHAFMLRTHKKEAAHTIDPILEPHVLKMQMTGGQAFSQLRDMLDATLIIDLNTGGETEQLPLSAVRGKAYDADPAIRKAAYEAEIAAYSKIELPMAACLNSIKGEARTIAALKSYDSVLDWMLADSRTDRATLDALMTAMRESLPHFRRYFRAKAKALGHPGGLPFYDLFAPMGASARTYTLEEAKVLLIETLGEFSAPMADLAARTFDERWLDAFPYQGKQGGAFCATVHPIGGSYILDNFDGSLSSVMTQAHELGHAYHGHCLKSNSILNADYPMPLAETASIFNETLMTQKLLARANREERIMLLEQGLADAAQVIVDILSRYLFETAVLDARAERTLNARELKEIMLSAQRETYGDGLDESLMHPYMWACKSHYYSVEEHFYNFPYAFGLLFGKGVYAKYREMGDAFVPLYDELLRATAIGEIAEVGASVGIDVRSVDFWRTSVNELVGAIDQFVEAVS